MAKYKVLWFDDEWQELEEISENALDFDIQLVGVGNAQDGLEELKKNIMEYQGVILDGKFYLDPSKTGDEINDDAFGEVARFLHDLHTQGQILPWFILSGQPQFVREHHNSVKLLGISSYERGKVFDKNRDEDKELFSLLVNAIESTPILKAFVKHRGVFEACEEKYLGDQRDRLFEIIKNLELQGPKNPEDLFTPLRKILERMVDRFSELGVVPEKLSLNDLKFFSKSLHRDYEFKTEIFPPLIAHLFNSAIDVVQDACHLKDDLRFKVDEYVQGSGTTYLYQSTALTILELTIWFRYFVEGLPSPEESTKLWKPKELHTLGIGEWVLGVINSGQNGWGNFTSEDGNINIGIPKAMMKNIDLSQKVKVKLKKDNSKHVEQIENI